MFNLPESRSKLIFYTGVCISLINDPSQNNKDATTKIVPDFNALNPPLTHRLRYMKQ